MHFIRLRRGHPGAAGETTLQASSLSRLTSSHVADSRTKIFSGLHPNVWIMSGQHTPRENKPAFDTECSSLLRPAACYTRFVK